MSCRLYLATPLALAEGKLAPAEFLPQLAAALAGGDVAAVLLRCDSPAVRPETVADLIRLLRSTVQEADAAFLVEGFLEQAAAGGCDGVQVQAAPKAVQRARDLLEEGAIVGAACGNSKHDAMVTGEQGADYVAFGSLGPGGLPADPEILAWWQEAMLLPSVAMGARSLREAESQARAGADFVLLEEAVWEDADGPASAVAWFERQLGG